MTRFLAPPPIPLMTVNPLFARLGISADADTLAGIRRLVSERVSETRHLDFKRQFSSADDLADDLAALANTGGGVLIVGVGTDNADRADSFHEQQLRVVEQQAVQAAREGIDEPLLIEPVPVAGDTDAARGFLVISVPPSDRTPHISVKRGRVLHRVGTHNKPMTRRELGAAFAAAGEMFAIEFGMARGAAGTTSVTCELISIGLVDNWIKVMNTGLLPALDIAIASANSQLLWATEGEDHDPWNPDHAANPPYLPIRNLPPGSDVVLNCKRELKDPKQDVLEVTWKTPDGQVHRNEQSWSWTGR